MVGFGEETLKGEAGGVLLGLLLGGSFGFGEGARAALFVVDANFDAEAFLMVGAALCCQDVVRLAGTGSLEPLLKCGFVIADGSAEGFGGLECEVEVREGRLDDVFFDESAGGVEASIEIKCRDDGFEGVGQQGGFSAASALLFSTP